MITASVDVQLTGLIANPQQLSSGAVAEFFRRARVVLAQDHAERFERSVAPDGSPWQPLSPPRCARACSKPSARSAVARRVPLCAQPQEGDS